MTQLRAEFTAGVAVLCAAAASLAAVLAAPSVIETGDLYWTIAAGRWMVENRAVLRIDPFSFTMAGHPWFTQEWLGQLGIAGAYLATGFASILALTGFAACLSVAALSYTLARFWRPALMAAGLILAVVVAAPAVKPLPYLLALPFAVCFTAGLIIARAEGRKPSLWLLLAFTAWANLHDGYVLGLVLTAGLGVEAWLSVRRLDQARDWLLFCGYTLMACFLTPYGLEGLAVALRLQAFSPSQPVPGLLPLLLALPAGAVLLANRKTWIRAGLLAALFVLSLYHAADRPYFAAAALLLCAEALSAGVRPVRFAWRPAAVFLGAALLALAARATVPLPMPDSPVRPETALAQVPEALRHYPVLNETAFGGFLITRDIKPFIDTRPLYPVSFRRRYAALGDAAALAQILSRYQIRWTLLSPANPAVKALDQMAGWHRLYSGPVAVVHVKDEAL